MHRRSKAIVIGSLIVGTVISARTENIPIPRSAPETGPSASLAGYPEPTGTTNTPTGSAGTFAYPMAADNSLPELKTSGASTGLHPGTTGPGRQRPGLWNSVNTSRRVVALTFDDGPHPELTPQLLDLLHREGIHATFFVLGSLATAHPEILRRMAAEGHEVANHTWDHPRLPSLGAEQFAHQIRDTTAIIEKSTGKKVTLMRPTYGLYNDRIKNELLGDYGLDVILWSVDPNDWKKPGADVVARRLINGARPGAILLSHDIHAGTIAAMPQVIAQLKAKGFEFATVSELLSMDEPAKPKPSPTPEVTSAGGDSPSRTTVR